MFHYYKNTFDNWKNSCTGIFAT